MHKKVLTEIDLYTGKVQMPKGFDIDRDKIKNDIIESFVKKNRINTNPQAYAFDDYVVPFSQPLQWMQDYIRDHWRVEYGSTLVQKICTVMLCILKKSLGQDIKLIQLIYVTHQTTLLFMVLMLKKVLQNVLSNMMIIEEKIERGTYL